MATSSSLQQRGTSLLRRAGYTSGTGPRGLDLRRPVQRRVQAQRRIADTQLALSATLGLGGALLAVPLALKTAAGRKIIANRLRQIKPMNIGLDTVNLGKELTRRKAREMVKEAHRAAQRWSSNSIDDLITRIFGEQPANLRPSWVQRKDIEFAFKPVHRVGPDYQQKVMPLRPDDLFIISRGTTRGQDPRKAIQYSRDNMGHNNFALSLLDKAEPKLKRALLWPMRFTPMGRRVKRRLNDEYRRASLARQASQRKEWIIDAYESQGLKPPELTASGSIVIKKPALPSVTKGKVTYYVDSSGRVRQKPAGGKGPGYLFDEHGNYIPLSVSQELPDFTEFNLARLKAGKKVTRQGRTFWFDKKRGVLLEKRGKDLYSHSKELIKQSNRNQPSTITTNRGRPYTPQGIDYGETDLVVGPAPKRKQPNKKKSELDNLIDEQKADQIHDKMYSEPAMPEMNNPKPVVLPYRKRRKR